MSEAVQWKTSREIGDHIKQLLRVLENVKSVGSVVIKKKPKKCRQSDLGENSRGSKYRGVSRCGNQWQVSKVILTL